MKPILVYVAGAYRAETVSGIYHNIHAARLVAEQVWRLGAVAVVPHMMTAYMDGLVPDRAFLDGTLELMRRCDCVVLVEGWEGSSGVRAEVDEANRRGIPVFQGEKSLGAWLSWKAGIESGGPAKDFIPARDGFLGLGGLGGGK